MSYLPRFDTEFAPKLGKRAKTFRMMFELLEAMDKPEVLILETGCAREIGCWDGDGQSTILFDDYLRFREGAYFLSIDTNPASIRLMRNLCSEKTDFIEADSVLAINRMTPNPEHPIDLLYLDSFDLDPENPHPSSLHHLKELAAAQKNLRSGSIIAVDDNHPNGVGKGAYVRDYLHNIGIEPIADDYQVVWVWK